MKAKQSAQILLRDARNGRWLAFREPLEIVVANNIDDVLPALEKVQTATTSGKFAAGFISYEAAPAFDPAFRTYFDTNFPLLFFGIFSQPEVVELPEISANFSLDWQVTTAFEKYQSAIAHIKSAIARGDTYQVNYTIRQIAGFSGDPLALFSAIAADAPFAAFIDLPDFTICSASPELFFEKCGKEIISRPMKGTAARGRTFAEDLQLRDFLATSEKDRAENAMIVDMIRNDIGRIAATGSVAVRDAFRIEKYPTVWQMTTTVTGQTDVSISEIFRAMFPCASITGAPKIRTMQIIADIEDTPRKIYTGTIGFISPDGDAQFNVAIRTAVIDKRNGRIEYGIGSGVVWDSDAAQEYQECRVKARVIVKPQQKPDFSLLESLRWSPDSGYFLCDAHIRRMYDSAAYFDFPFDETAIRRSLANIANSLPKALHKVRLLLFRNGGIFCEAAKISDIDPQSPLKIALAAKPVDSSDPFLFHKTTHRAVYATAKAAAPHADDVLLWNERGEITEGCIYNVLVKVDGEWFTPPVDCGLLNGTYRQYLLDCGDIRERIILKDELANAEEIVLINSVRKWRNAVLVGSTYR